MGFFMEADRLFCALFTIELVVRLAAYRQKFFDLSSSDGTWNYFDLVVVSMSLADQLVIAMDGTGKRHTSHHNFLRVVRIFRFIRVLRLARALRFIRELKTLVSCVLGCMRSLAWTLLSLMMYVYICSVCFTIFFADLREELASIRTKGSTFQRHDELLEYYFGSVSRTMLTLFAVGSDGLEWHDTCVELFQITVAGGMAFVAYTLLMTMFVMNIIMTMFLETAMKESSQEMTRFLAQHVLQSFDSVDEDLSGDVGWEEFAASLQDPASCMHKYFEEMNIDISQADSLFKLIDIDGSGRVDPVEFVGGCLRLRGQAQAIDLALLAYNTREMHEREMAHICNIGESLADFVRENFAALMPDAHSVK